MEELPYLEVAGQGQVEEHATRFFADIRASAEGGRENAATVEDAEGLRAEVVAALFAAGLTEEEVFDGGRQAHRPWFFERRRPESIENRVLLEVGTAARLRLALDALEPLHGRLQGRARLDVDLRPPLFDGEAGGAEALEMAYLHARAKAEALARIMGVTLGGVLRVAEGKRTVRASGFAGDRAGRFTDDVAMEFERETSADAPELPAPTRIAWVEVRFRFEIIHPPAAAVRGFS